MEDDVTKDLAEFSFANAIYAALIEGHACEISARFVINVTLLVLIHRLNSQPQRHGQRAKERQRYDFLATDAI